VASGPRLGPDTPCGAETLTRGVRRLARVAGPAPHASTGDIPVCPDREEVRAKLVLAMNPVRDWLAFRSDSVPESLSTKYFRTESTHASGGYF